ncbi:B2 bradykinin receptor [Bagarius yarrelli]|uniref:B2 bradykinin receptor n=1 Tax=Bagarius yarrelli TaxID=175774 RepID=A0A556VWI0_BAGYA|nr:B2 bradykinin receptor [Bagarius yarrelli]
MELNLSHTDWEFKVENCSYQTAWDWISALQPWWLSVISVLGLLGNGLVLLVFCLQRNQSSVADVYLGNLSMANLVMVVCLPFWAVTIAQDYKWIFGQTFCKLINTAISMNYFCSIFFLVLVSVDRYLALARTMSRSRLRRSSWAKRICLAIWVFGFLVSLPSLVFRDVRYIPELEVHACYLVFPHQGWRLQKNLSSNVLGFVIPLPIIAFCTYHTVNALKDAHLSFIPGARTEKRAARLVLAVLAVFLFCWTPHQLVRLLDTLDYYQLLPAGCFFGHVLDISEQFSTYLAYADSAVNPFLYVVVGKHFRRRAKGVFKEFSAPGRKNSTPNGTLASRCSEGRKDSVVIDKRVIASIQISPSSLTDLHRLGTACLGIIPRNRCTESQGLNHGPNHRLNHIE